METSSLQTYTESWDAGLNRVTYQEPWGEAGAFTTMRLDVGASWCCAYLLERHVARLFKTFADLGWSALFEERWVEERIRTFVKQVEGEGRYHLRVMLSDVILSLRAAPAAESQPMQSGQIWQYSRPTPAYKTLDYGDVLDALAGIDRTREELLLVSDDGRLLEGATSCLIFIGGGRLVVPERDRLNSITLELIREKWRGVEIVTDDVYTGEVKQYDEILLCGSGKGVINLAEIPELEWEHRATSAYRAVRILHDNALIDYKYTWM